jgi:hypothetical protein
MRAARALLVLICLVTLQGCAAAVLSVAGIAGGAGFKHFINGMVSQTIPSPIAGTRLATLKTLKRMGMPVVKDELSGDGWKILAKATDREIDIDLEALNEKSTQLRVDVHRDKFIYLKDHSTGTEIIEQTRVEAARLSLERSRIASAQMMLGELGYDTKNPDGIIGPKTRRAIARFQRGNSIQVDERVSPQLMAKLRKKRDAIKAKRKKARLLELHQ